jgi:hypothetical protein
MGVAQKIMSLVVLEVGQFAVGCMRGTYIPGEISPSEIYYPVYRKLCDERL